MCMVYEFRGFRFGNRLYGAAMALALWRRFLADRDGATMVIIGITMPVLIGTMGLAAEVSYWHHHQRAMQNAADAAALAAATASDSNYTAEANAVAAQYGIVNGSGQVVVTAANPATAPGCTSKCYTVLISDSVPLVLSQIVGFQGNTTVNGRKMTNMTAFAVATSQNAYSYCLVALAGSGKAGITSNGAPDTALAGCNTMSNTSAKCNGHDLGSGISNAHTTNSGCGVISNSNVPVMSDPYADMAKNIPANPCSSYPQEPAKKNDPALPAQNQWLGTKSIPSGGSLQICGDLQLTGNTVINAPAGGALVIYNGQLDTNGYKLSTADGSSVAVVFSGTAGNYQHIPTGGGTLDLQAPTSGPWSGVAMYQDPALTQGVDFTAAGSKPILDLTGLVYMPHSSVTVSGAINHSTYGQACLVLVTDNVTINGTGSILANNATCPVAGLQPPGSGNYALLVN